MKKIFTLLFGLALGASAFAQIDPTTGQGVVHIWNHNDYHDLDLKFTLFTVNPTTCSPSFQALGPTIPLPPGELTKYAKYTSSDTASGHPYPIDGWYNGSYLLPNQIPAGIAYDQRWGYMKFQLQEPGSTGLINPTLGGSVGFYQSCTNVPASLSGSGTSQVTAITYNFVAKAVIIGGDLWIDVY